MKFGPAEIISAIVEFSYVAFLVAFAGGVAFVGILLTHGRVMQQDAFGSKNVVECLHALGPILLIVACVAPFLLLAAVQNKRKSGDSITDKSNNTKV
jgi:hypothetical protein